HCCYATPRDPNSFPTRRSSDLVVDNGAVARVGSSFVDFRCIAGEEAHLVHQMLTQVQRHCRKGREGSSGGGLINRKRTLTGNGGDRKSTRLNSSHVKISYAVFC